MEIEQPAVTQEPAGSLKIVNEQKEEELVVTQESAANEQEDIESPWPTQMVMEQKEEELAVTQESAANEQEDTESPRPTQIVMEQEREELVVTQELARNGEEDIESPQPTQIITEQKILVDAYTQTEPPSVSDACIETDSFQELKGIWWKEYETSQGEAFQQQKGI